MSGSDEGLGVLAERYSAEAQGYLDVYSPLLLPFQRALMGLVDLPGSRRVLDLGSGPGAAIPDMRAAVPTALVVAGDRAFGMLALAPVDSPRVTLDAMRLPFADASFDVVTMAFVAFHLPDPVAGFAESARVLRPGGRLGIATWGADEVIGPAWNVWEEELDRAGAPPKAATGLPDYLSLGTREALSAPLEQAGLGPIGFQTSRWNYRPSHPDWMAFMTRHVFSERLAELGEAGRLACIAAVRARTGALPTDDLGLDADVLFAVARR